jgi:hypothetical protein
MLEAPHGITRDGRQLLKELPGVFVEVRAEREGGYVPPEQDPTKCEPAREGDKSGFEYRVENKATTPFPRCDKLRCKVREQCTALVLERISV